MIGHPQGASGAAGVVTTALALDRGFLPPTINLINPDPACDLDFVPGKGRAARPAAALCNCLGFGSKNSALVLGAAGVSGHRRRDADDVAVVGGRAGRRAGRAAAGRGTAGGCGCSIANASRAPKLCGDTLNPGALAVLARHLDLAPLAAHGPPIRGMRLSGPGGVPSCGTYPDGVAG